MLPLFKEKPLSEYGYGELAAMILAVIALGTAFTGLLIIAPGIGGLFAILKPKNKHDRQKIRRALTSLQQKGLITVKGREGSFAPTQTGIAQAHYDILSIKQSKWDKKWHLVMFDIPETKRGARIALSNKVLSMGMRHLQDSVFISPYPCEKEIRAAARFLQVEPFVLDVTATSISNETRYIKEFDL